MVTNLQNSLQLIDPTTLSTKLYDPKALQSGVVDLPGVSENQKPGYASFVFNVGQYSSSIPAWGLDIRYRDQMLREFWPTEPILAGAVGSMVHKLTTTKWQIVPADPTKGRAKNTVRQVTANLRNADRGNGWKVFLTKTLTDLYCLAGPTRISLGGDRRGQTKTIAQMVKDKDVGPVLSMDYRGVIVERYVNEWHKTPLADRKWYWLSLENSNHSGSDRGGIFLTEDHPMLTERGWVQAKDIKPTDKVATKDPQPSYYQMQILVGGLLGDMSMTQLPNRSLIRFSHSVKQEPYMLHKMKYLKGIEWTGYNYSTSHIDQNESETVGVNSKASLGFNDLYDRWYGSGERKLNREDFTKYFSPLMMAVWYMDDGGLQEQPTTAGNMSSHGILCTDNFAVEDVEWMINFLTQHGFICTLQMVSGYPRIRFNAVGFKKFVDTISPYIVPSMRYKLPIYIRNSESYDQALWEAVDPATVYFDAVHTIKQRDYKQGSRVIKTTYHIGVEETHNFVAAGMVSHNTQDNGAFVELIRRENRPDSPILQIAHLDSHRCQRTGDPETPVLYTDRHGKEHLLKWWHVITLEEMPSPIEQLYGVQVSALSRCLRAAEILRDIEIYKHEKVSGRFARSIHFISGVTNDMIEDAMRKAKENDLNLGVVRYVSVPIFGTYDPKATLNHTQIDLASLPDSFDEKETFQQYIAQLALAFGVDYQEFAPLPGGQMGSSSQSEILHLKARGKGPAAIMEMIENKINDNKIVPSNVRFEFVIGDDSASKDAAEARFMRSKDLSLRVTSGIYDAQAAIEISYLDGDIPEHIFERLMENPPEPTREPDPTTTEQVTGGDQSTMERQLLLATQKAVEWGYLDEKAQSKVEELLQGYITVEDFQELMEEDEALNDFFTTFSNVSLYKSNRDDARADMIMRLQRRDEMKVPKNEIELTHEDVEAHLETRKAGLWQYINKLLRTKNPTTTMR